MTGRFTGDSVTTRTRQGILLYKGAVMSRVGKGSQIVDNQLEGDIRCCLY